MILEKQTKESSSLQVPRDGYNQPVDQNTNSNYFGHKHASQMGTYFFAKVNHVNLLWIPFSLNKVNNMIKNSARTLSSAIFHCNYLYPLYPN